jgi:biopolymer transport protein TolQ
LVATLMQWFFWPTAVQTGGLLQTQDMVAGMVAHSGSVVQGVLYMLFAFSVGSWGIIFYKLYQFRLARRKSQHFSAVFWETRNLASTHTASLEMKESPIAQVFRAGYQELIRVTSNHKQSGLAEREAAGGEGGVENVERAMRRAMREQITWLERTLAFLATTASTAPFIGLFGTVWGIMNAFRGLSLTQSSSVQAVAPGIAEALIATAVGLAAAIPAVMAYNYFSRQVRVLASDMENFSAEFLNIADRHFL